MFNFEKIILIYLDITFITISQELHYVFQHFKHLFLLIHKILVSGVLWNQLWQFINFIENHSIKFLLLFYIVSLIYVDIHINWLLSLLDYLGRNLLSEIVVNLNSLCVWSVQSNGLGFDFWVGRQIFGNSSVNSLSQRNINGIDFGIIENSFVAAAAFCLILLSGSVHSLGFKNL